MASGSRTWTVFGLLATLTATVVTRKALTTSWKMATGKNPPTNPEHPDVSMAEALAWAAFSGVAVGVARMLATRKAASYYRRSTGRLPGNLNEVTV